MKKLCVLLFGFALALPLHAQTDGSTDAAPAAADASSTGSAAPAGDTPAAPADTAAAPADAPAAPATDAAAAPAADASAAAAPASDAAPADAAASTDTAPAADAAAPAADAAASSETPSAEAAPAEAPAPAPAETAPANPHHLYAGAEFNRVTVQVSDPAMATAFGGQDFVSKFYTVRAGIRLFDVIGLELQGGAKGDNGTEPNHVEMGSYYGVFVVPTGNVFDLFEVAASIGFNSFTLQRGNASQKFTRPSFGINMELPLREISESIPDLRLTAGYKIFYEEHQARVYGYHVGVRFDFTL